ncbi:hypothetical protein VX159_12750 [Dechloromonas sp. ZY10]|uniref:hypothetical protein n=1 Tax=Dechloromonas aquae TaxID=2664436 RepID=UPI003527C23A
MFYHAPYGTLPHEEKKLIVLCRWFCLLACLPGLALASDRRPPVYPFALVNVWWKCSQTTDDLQELRVDFEIVREVSADYALYIAPLGLIRLAEIAAYGGLQTQVHAWNSLHQQKPLTIGRGALFSRWARDGGKVPLAFMRGEAETYYEADGYEGEFASVRSRYAWRSGHYSYRLVREQVSPPAGYSGRWYAASIERRGAGEVPQYIGSLFFEGKHFPLRPRIANFVEVYGRRSQIPESEVIFSPPQINGQPCLPERVTPNFSVKYPKRYATFEQLPDGRARVVAVPEGY